MCLIEKKERGSPAPLQREKNLEIKRESTIFISASFVPSLSWLDTAKSTRVCCEADVVMTSATPVCNISYRNSQGTVLLPQRGSLFAVFHHRDRFECHHDKLLV